MTQSISSWELFDLVKASAGAGNEISSSGTGRVDSSALQIERNEEGKKKKIEPQSNEAPEWTC